jgi:hypothetical protein
MDHASSLTTLAPSAVEVAPPETITSCAFNQDCSCVAIGTVNAYCIGDTETLSSHTHRPFRDGVAYIAMLERTNLIAIVPFAPDRNGPGNTLLLWDDHTDHCIAELRVRSPICGVRMRCDEILVLQPEKAEVYRFLHQGRIAMMSLAMHAQTALNYKGHHAWAVLQDVLALPHILTGRVLLRCRERRSASHMSDDVVIEAHRHAIVALALSVDGAQLATASTAGTLVRLFDTVSGQLLRECRRGLTQADVYSLSLSRDARWLAASSSDGVVAVFGVGSGCLFKTSSTNSTNSTTTTTTVANTSSTASGASTTAASAAAAVTGYLWATAGSAWARVSEMSHRVQQVLPRVLTMAERPVCLIRCPEAGSWWPGLSAAVPQSIVAFCLGTHDNSGNSSNSDNSHQAAAGCDMFSSMGHLRPAASRTSPASSDDSVILYIAHSDGNFHRVCLLVSMLEQGSGSVDLPGPSQSLYDLLHRGSESLYSTLGS